MKRSVSIAAILLFGFGAVAAQSNPPGGSASGAQNSSSPATDTRTGSTALPQDGHDGLTISVDPYSDAQRAKEKFGKAANPVPAGILPVDVFLKNETPHPVKIKFESVQLYVRLQNGNHQEIDWLTVGEVANLIVHPGGTPGAPSARRFPVGIPAPSKDKKVAELAAQLRPFSLDSDVVPPLASVHGFLFFNMSHDFTAVARSSLYVPDLAFLPDQKALMFFEVPLSTAPTAPTPASQP